MFTSPPRVSVRGSAGSARTVTLRYPAPARSCTHSARRKPGSVTYGVDTAAPCTQGPGSRCTGPSTGKVRVVRKYGVKSAGPPARAAGFTQALTSPGVSGRVKGPPTGGASARKEAYVITQPVCPPARHSGTLRKVPPTS